MGIVSIVSVNQRFASPTLYIGLFLQESPDFVALIPRAYFFAGLFWLLLGPSNFVLMLVLSMMMLIRIFHRSVQSQKPPIRVEQLSTESLPYAARCT